MDENAKILLLALLIFSMVAYMMRPDPVCIDVKPLYHPAIYDAMGAIDPRMEYMFEVQTNQLLEQERCRKLTDSILIHELMTDPKDRVWADNEYDSLGQYYPDVFKWYEEYINSE